MGASILFLNERLDAACLRIFNDEAGRMNRSVLEVGGGVLLISQFTLYGATRKGRRPSFDAAARPEEARRLCVRLGDFLRRSLTLGSRERIPLSEELDLAEALLSIEKVRFGDRLSHDIQADERSRHCTVPPLVLQPLVENAVTHGIAQMLDGGAVRIAAEQRGERLLIVVENPRDPDSPDPKGAGIGLQNVRRRLTALYHGEADLRVRSEPQLFRVELRLPCSE